jgi:Cu-Zn family superoxide dismutase
MIGKNLLLAAAVAMSCGCLFAEGTTEAPPKPNLTQRANCVLHPTKGNKVEGIVSFTKVEGGVKIVAEVHNLTPGSHGFHIHEFGDCSAPDGMSAGGHFNPKGTKHGGPDSAERHAGDLGNLEADSDGVAHYERIDNVIQLDGPDTIVGRSVVVHSNADDFTSQPAGNAGSRVACGVIEH